MSIDIEQASHIARVAELNRKIGNQIPERPVDPGEGIRRTLAMLILRECLETVAGLGFKATVTGYANKDHAPYGDKAHSCDLIAHPLGMDMLEVADGVADLSVVAHGAALRCGINMTPIIKFVDFANLRKFNKRYVKDVNAVGGSRVATPVECKEQGLGGYLEWEGKDAGKWIKPSDWVGPEKEITAELERQKRDGAWG